MRKTTLTTTALLAAAGLTLAACAPDGSDGQVSEPAPTSTTAGIDAPAEPTRDAEQKTIELIATSTTSGTVMWGDVLGGSMNSEDIGTHWNSAVPADADQNYTITVTGDYMDPASQVTCEIKVNGETVDTAQGSGAAGSATCTQPLF